jgi:hypothetical protein
VKSAAHLYRSSKRTGRLLGNFGAPTSPPFTASNRRAYSWAAEVRGCVGGRQETSVEEAPWSVAWSPSRTLRARSAAAALTRAGCSRLRKDATLAKWVEGGVRFVAQRDGPR